MRLDSEFIRLPIAIDAAKLLEEANQFSEYEWDYHPQRYDGNTALSLVSSGGGRSDSYVGSMQATEALKRAPYVQQIMAALGTVIGRSRFMRLAPGSNVPPHSDTDYTWRNRVRIHIPVITDPGIIFSSIGSNGEQGVDVHMQAGEAWIFDNWREHAVYNDSEVRRIHLVIDTVGSSEFWALAKAGWDPKTPIANWSDSVVKLEFEPQAKPVLNLEAHNILPVRPPDEIENMVADFLSEIEGLQLRDSKRYLDIHNRLQAFCQDWRAFWAMYWDTPDNVRHYQALAQSVKASLNDILANVLLKSNGAKAYEVISNWLDLTTSLDVSHISASSVGKRSTVMPSSNDINTNSYAGTIPIFDRPLFIVSAPRAGSTMVFETFRNNKELWSIGDVMHRELEGISKLDPSHNAYISNALNAPDYKDEYREQILGAITARLRNTRFIAYSEMQAEFQPPSIRLLEQTPKNALRIPFLKAMFPQAKFLFVHRDPRASMASMIEAWQSQRFVTYPDLPDWQGMQWSLPLIEGWQSLIGKSLAEVVAVQWAQISNTIINDLSMLDTQDYSIVSYEDWLSQPSASMKSICEFADVPFGPRIQSFVNSGFPNSKYVISKPEAGKWRLYQEDLRQVSAHYESVEQSVLDFIETHQRSCG